MRNGKEVSLISAINSGLSGLAVHSAMVTTAAGNLANLNTTGYKSSRLALGTLRSMTRGGYEVGQGAQVLGTSRDFSSGSLLSTGSEFNLAIQGDGFFRVSRGGEDVYTRDGAFHLDNDRYVVDAQGNRLQPDLQLPADAASVQVDRNGHLTALDAGGNTVATADIPLYRFADPNGLESLGQNDFQATEASGPPLQSVAGTGGAGGLTQAALEGSNVDPAREMVDLMLGQRGFQASIKVLQTAGEMLGTVLDIRA
ncbi:MAG: flagellar hook basal-body protein [Deltaproteobacteria bacterium]|nr:flagellar hook basal-body protein [Deltaproteobacteria bacterium]